MSSVDGFGSRTNQVDRSSLLAGSSTAVAGDTRHGSSAGTYHTAFEAMDLDVFTGTVLPMPNAVRILERDLAFHQSEGNMCIRRVDPRGATLNLRRRDLFHSFVNMRTWKILVIASCLLVTSWLWFAFLFWVISVQCELTYDDKRLTFIKAMSLSIVTVQTIGYGIPHAYFNDCKSGLVVLVYSGLWHTLFDAAIIAAVYTRISRGGKRATSVCCSRQAIIKEIDGECFFMFQCCDFRKHQLCEAHVRLYGIMHNDTASTYGYQPRPMRLSHPDDSLGGMLLLVVPQIVMHRIDPWSPLCPPRYRHRAGCTPANSYRWPEILQRACDVDCGARGGAVPGGVELEKPSVQEVADHVRASYIEVLCVVEGIDVATSNNVQKQHSYTCEDIVYNGSFVQCVKTGADRVCEVDFDKLHLTVGCSTL